MGSVGKFSNNKIGGVVSVLLQRFMTKKCVLQGSVRFVGKILTDNGHAHLRKPPQTETHTPTATPNANRNPPLSPARRLTPVALGRRHDALLRELHHQRRQLLTARNSRAGCPRLTVNRCVASGWHVTTSKFGRG